MKVKFLKAFNGDCIHLSFFYYGSQRNILIDGGTGATYQSWDKNKKTISGELKELIEQLRSKKEKIDLLILTHVDDDHVGGLLKWFEKDDDALSMIKKIWFNSGSLIADYFMEQKKEEHTLKVAEKTNYTSIGQGVTFEKLIAAKKNCWHKQIINSGREFNYLGLGFRILSPGNKNLSVLLNKWEKEAPASLHTSKTNDYALSFKEHIAKDIFEEDDKPHNGSSIAFILTYNKKELLFLADAHPSVIIDSLAHFGYTKLAPLKASIVKLSHHGSACNNSREMLECLDTDCFIVSTNGKSHNHPDKQMLSRLCGATKQAHVYFNYPALIDSIFTPADRKYLLPLKPVELLNNELTV